MDQNCQVLDNLNPTPQTLRLNPEPNPIPETRARNVTLNPKPKAKRNPKPKANHKNKNKRAKPVESNFVRASPLTCMLHYVLRVVFTSCSIGCFAFGLL